MMIKKKKTTDWYAIAVFSLFSFFLITTFMYSISLPSHFYLILIFFITLFIIYIYCLFIFFPLFSPTLLSYHLYTSQNWSIGFAFNFFVRTLYISATCFPLQNWASFIYVHTNTNYYLFPLHFYVSHLYHCPIMLPHDHYNCTMN